MEKYLSDQDLYLFDTLGFINISNFLSNEEVQIYKNNLNVLHDSPCEYRNTIRFDNIVQQSSIMRELACNHNITCRVNDVINQPFRLIESYATKRNAGSVLYLHSGLSELLRYGQGTATRTMSAYHTFHNGKIYCMYIKAVVYLEDVQTVADGPFCYLQGSHKANYSFHQIRQHQGNTSLTPLTEVGFPSLSTIFVKAGDLLLLNESLLHGTYPKESDSERIILAFSYAPSFLSDWKPLERASDDIFTAGYEDGEVEEQYVK